VAFTATVSEGDSYSFNVVPNATYGSVINQFSRDPMVIDVTSNNNTPARFFNMSTASGTISGDLNGSIEFKWNRLDFATPYLPEGGRFITSPDGVGILYLNVNVTGTELGDFVIVGVADLDYSGSLVKGKGLVSTREEWVEHPTNLTAPARVLIGEMSYQISGGTITGTFTLRNYSKTPVGLEGRVDTTVEYLWLQGQLVNDESDWITNATTKFVQFTKDPVNATHRKVLEEMAAGREVDQDITAGDMGVGGKISLMRTGVLDVVAAGAQDIPVNSVTATRTIENNTGSDNATKRGVAKTIVLVDMRNFTLSPPSPGVNQTAFTFMPSYSYNYMGTGYYAGVESYVIAATHIDLNLYLQGPDYRYVLKPTPVVSSVSPNVGKAGDTLAVTIEGKWFWTDETYNPLTISFGPNVTVTSHAVVSDTEITASITIGGGAGIGASNVTVTKRGQTGTLTDGFGIGGAMAGQVDFAGRTSGNNSYIDSFVVMVFDNATQNLVKRIDPTTNKTGFLFLTTGLDVNKTYDVAIDSRTSVSQMVQNVALTLNGTVLLSFGTIRVGDANQDESIGTKDKAKLYKGWGTSKGSLGWNADADFNNDGSLGTKDKALLYKNWGRSGDLGHYPYEYP
jgi:hypothetical protein